MKKYIFQLEKQQLGADGSYRDLESNERVSLIDHDSSAIDALFRPLLDRELTKITLFYESQEKELLEELSQLEQQIKDHEEAGPDAGYHYMYHDDDDDDDDDNSPSRSRPPRRRRRKSTSVDQHSRFPMGQTIPEESPVRHRYSSSSEDGGDLDPSLIPFRSSRPSRSPVGTIGKLANRLHFMRESLTSSVHDTIWNSDTNYAYDTRLLFKRRIRNLYISLSSLKSYVEINYTGFRKILKK